MTTIVTIQAGPDHDVDIFFEEQERVPEGLEALGPRQWKLSKRTLQAGSATQVSVFDTCRVAGIREIGHD